MGHERQRNSYSWVADLLNCSRRAKLAIVIICTVLSGCATDDGKATISGTVTLDGQPLNSGVIRFVPVDGQTPTAEAVITDGEFRAEVPLGEKQVSISSSKVVGKRQAYEALDSPTVDMVEELLPPRYNLQSELTIKVEDDNPPASFTLTSG